MAHLAAVLNVGPEVLALVEAKIAARQEEIDTRQEEIDTLKQENERLRQALKDVCSPMQMFLCGIPPDSRHRIDGGTMARLCDWVGFIQEIARKALEHS